MTVARIRLPDDPEERQAVAVRTLAMLIELFERGMREPLPLYCKTSAAYAAAVAAGKDGRAAAEKEWTSELELPEGGCRAGASPRTGWDAHGGRVVRAAAAR